MYLAVEVACSPSLELYNGPQNGRVSRTPPLYLLTVAEIPGTLKLPKLHQTPTFVRCALFHKPLLSGGSTRRVPFI